MTDAPITKRDRLAALTATQTVCEGSFAIWAEHGDDPKRARYINMTSIAQGIANARAEGAAEARGTWSTERPTAAGYYWVRNHAIDDDDDPGIVLLVTSGDTLAAWRINWEGEVLITSRLFDGAEWCPAVAP